MGEVAGSSAPSMMMGMSIIAPMVLPRLTQVGSWSDRGAAGRTLVRGAKVCGGRETRAAGGAMVPRMSAGESISERRESHRLVRGGTFF